MNKNRVLIILIISVIAVSTLLTVVFSISKNISQEIVSIYQSRQSEVYRDRFGNIISIEPNEEGNYAVYWDDFPEKFKNILLKKEDKFFYFHPGINPISTFRAFSNLIKGDNNLAHSTITQQLTKILLGQETNRTYGNKFKETLYAISMELFMSKKEILNMYLNSVYFGNKIQGLFLASQFYYDTLPTNLSEDEMIELLVTIESPSNNNPLKKNNNEKKALEWSKKLKLKDYRPHKSGETSNLELNSSFFFDIQNLVKDCHQNCILSIDRSLNEKIRAILKKHLSNLNKFGATHGAIIVINPKTNQLTAIIGSPDPTSNLSGDQINMAVQPRAIGSTIKPFIYLKAFQKGLRPYTLVDDREYKYEIESGFSFYPKNYDYQYRGIVSLHEALSNSLNVPTVKTLEYVGVQKFNNFLLEDLKFSPIQPLENYSLGIALGQLEMSPLQLAYYFTVLANSGQYTPLKICLKNCTDNLVDSLKLNNKISSSGYVQMVNKILTDNSKRVDQFGLVNNLKIDNYEFAVKTGTSRDYHDSWTVGYNPDLLVLVWVGNTLDTPMENISGAIGSGAIWNNVARTIINDKKSNPTSFNFDQLRKVVIDGEVDYGLPADDVSKKKEILLELDKSLILNPHDSDVYKFTPDMGILLKAKAVVNWEINNKNFDSGAETIFKPKAPGSYQIDARGNSKNESINIQIN